MGRSIAWRRICRRMDAFAAAAFGPSWRQPDRGHRPREQLGGVLAEGDGIQSKHGPVALRGIGGQPLEWRRPHGSVQGQIGGGSLGVVLQVGHRPVAHGGTRGRRAAP